MSDEIPIDHLRTWIGKKDHQTDIITPELVKRFNATLGGYTKITTRTSSRYSLVFSTA